MHFPQESRACFIDCPCMDMICERLFRPSAALVPVALRNETLVLRPTVQSSHYSRCLLPIRLLHSHAPTSSFSANFELYRVWVSCPDGMGHRRWYQCSRLVYLICRLKICKSECPWYSGRSFSSVSYFALVAPRMLLSATPAPHVTLYGS